MSLPHAILGLLQTEPMSGYDLKTKHFDCTLSHFWPADQAQIYRTLEKLEEKGLIESEVEIQQDRPNRKVYTVTPTGEEEFQKWLTEPQPEATVRNPSMIQLFFSYNLPDSEVIKLLKNNLDACRKKLQRWETVCLPLSTFPERGREAKFQKMTLDFVAKMKKSQMEWLEECIQELESQVSEESKQSH